MKRLKKLFFDTILLTGVSLLMRFMGMGFSVWLSRKIGASGVGLYELLMSVYSLAVVLAASGIRLSAIRLVVEHNSASRSVIRLCCRYALALGSSAGILLFIFAQFIASRWLNVPETALSLRILACSLPLLSISSALSGYFTAARRAGRYSLVQTLEQICRIILSAFLLQWLLPRGVHYACIALVIANCVAETLSLFTSILLYQFEKPGDCSPPSGLFRKLLSIALPDAIGSWIRSALVTAKQLLIPRGLKASGASAEQALSTYGVIQGMTLPVLSFPAAFLGALSGLLIPEVTECHAQGQHLRMRYIIRRVVHITLLFSFGAMGLLLAFAKPLGFLLYQSEDAARYIFMLAPLTPLIYLDMTVDAFLKGLGLQTASMRYNIIDAAMCLTLVLVLIPKVGLPGYLLMLALSESLNLILSIRKLRLVTGFEPETVRNIIIPAACALLPLLWGDISYEALCRSVSPVAALVFASIFVSLGYWASLFLLGSATKEDWRWFRNILH